MKRASYREALEWIALNDDCEWLFPGRDYDGPPAISVSAALVADLFAVGTERVIRDLTRTYTKLRDRENGGRRRAELTTE